MLFWLKKVVSFWLMPLPLCLAALVSGILLLRYTRRRRLGRFLIIAPIVVLLVASNKFVAKSLMRSLETQFPAIPEFTPGDPLPPPLAACRYVVILGGGNGYTPGLAASNTLSSAARGRFLEGMRLLRVLPEAKMIATGGGRDGEEPHAHVLGRAARAFGLAPEHILYLTEVRDTEDESRAVKALVGDAPVALVTSASHMPRAFALFRGAGVNTLACPADYGTHEDPGFRIDDYFWEVGAIGGTTRGLQERLGRLWVWLRGKT